jgi:hypothetical protein
MQSVSRETDGSLIEYHAGIVRIVAGPDPEAFDEWRASR